MTESLFIEKSKNFTEDENSIKKIVNLINSMEVDRSKEKRFHSVIDWLVYGFDAETISLMVEDNLEDVLFGF